MADEGDPAPPASATPTPTGAATPVAPLSGKIEGGLASGSVAPTGSMGNATSAPPLPPGANPNEANLMQHANAGQPNASAQLAQLTGQGIAAQPGASSNAGISPGNPVPAQAPVSLIANATVGPDAAARPGAHPAAAERSDTLSKANVSLKAEAPPNLEGLPMQGAPSNAETVTAVPGESGERGTVERQGASAEPKPAANVDAIEKLASSVQLNPPGSVGAPAEAKVDANADAVKPDVVMQPKPSANPGASNEEAAAKPGVSSASAAAAILGASAKIAGPSSSSGAANAINTAGAANGRHVEEEVIDSGKETSTERKAPSAPTTRSKPSSAKSPAASPKPDLPRTRPPSARRSTKRGGPATLTTAIPARKQHELSAATLMTGIEQLDTVISQLQRDQKAGKLSLDVAHLTDPEITPAELVDTMISVVDERSKPSVEFVLGVLGIKKVPAPLLERQRNQGQKALGVAVKNRAIAKRREAQKVAKEKALAKRQIAKEAALKKAAAARAAVKQAREEVAERQQAMEEAHKKAMAKKKAEQAALAARKRAAVQQSATRRRNVVGHDMAPRPAVVPPKMPTAQAERPLPSVAEEITKVAPVQKPAAAVSVQASGQAKDAEVSKIVVAAAAAPVPAPVLTGDTTNESETQTKSETKAVEKSTEKPVAKVVKTVQSDPKPAAAAEVFGDSDDSDAESTDSAQQQDVEQGQADVAMSPARTPLPGTITKPTSTSLMDALKEQNAPAEESDGSESGDAGRAKQTTTSSTRGKSKGVEEGSSTRRGTLRTRAAESTPGRGRGRGRGRARGRGRGLSASSSRGRGKGVSGASSKGRKGSKRTMESEDESESASSSEEEKATAKASTPGKRKTGRPRANQPEEDEDEIQPEKKSADAEEEEDDDDKTAPTNEKPAPSLGASSRERRMYGRRASTGDILGDGGRKPRLRRESANLNQTEERSRQLWLQDARLGKCLNRIMDFPLGISSIFQNPVSEKDAPGYYDKIKKPMDLSTIKENLLNGTLTTPAEVLEDMMLIVSNCVEFNGEDSDLYDLAQDFGAKAKEFYEPLVEQWNIDEGITAASPEGDKQPGPSSRLRHSSRRASHKPNVEEASETSPPSKKSAGARGRGRRRSAGVARAATPEESEEEVEEAPPAARGRRGRGRGAAASARGKVAGRGRGRRGRGRGGASSSAGTGRKRAAPKTEPEEVMPTKKRRTVRTSSRKRED